MDSTTAELLTISAFARRVGLTPSALRFYDDCRVLRPVSVDASTGYRHYSPDQEERAVLLRGLRAAGLPLAEVAAVLDGEGEEARAILERHRVRERERARGAEAAIASVLRGLGAAGERTAATLGGAELASAVRQVAPAAGADPEHPVLGCVSVEIDGGEVRFAATDRYRLSLRTLRPSAARGPGRRLLLTAADLVGLSVRAAREAEVTLEADARGARILLGGLPRELPLVEAEFPAYREMLAALAPAAHRRAVDRVALLGALDSCGDVPAVVLRPGADRLAVGLPDGSRTTVLAAVGQGGECPPIGFDPAVLAPALEASVGPDVLLEIVSAAQPVVVRSADQGDFTTLVMPLSLDRPGRTRP
ncbi:MerR family transcriptional regulator [Streptomyces sp. NPDC020141]|uniref:DNA polymerase III subunit beta family protein n=1 Tax=Streptomyces sp. NPDC020141 TaxID=3365065 RepID=UPI0037A34619